MSTIKVSNLQHASAASAAIVLASDSTATAQLSSINGGPLSGTRNRIINGDMRIDQRNAGASVTPASSAFTLDRWGVLVSQTNKFSVQQNAGSVTPPTGYKSYLGVTSLSAYSVVALDYFSIYQVIEGYNIADLDWGSASAKTITLSFWVRSSLTGTFGGVVSNQYTASGRYYPFSYTITSANTWEQKTIMVAGDTSGTWGSTNGNGIVLQFSLGVGSTYASAAGSWTGTYALGATGATSVVGTNGATFYITGVQLEAGTVATPFERRSYGQELMLCQRYFFAVKASEQSDTYCRFVQGDLEGTTVFTSCYTLPVRMRVTPTLTTTGTASNYAVYHAGTITPCSTVPSIPSGNPQTVVVLAVVSSGLSAGRGATLLANNNNTAYLYYGAEL
jgi:hypothetical protein